MALYRKYRPATFAEVVGQEHVTTPLSAALNSRGADGEPNRINHAYLFSGPRGCGKTSSARILARSLNCVEGPTSEPCGKCDSCVALAPGGAGSLDVMELDAASHNGVDDMRDLREQAAFNPANAKYRIFIIDEAHMISTQGFNALLKVVEEPPEHLIFIFATTEPEKMLPTIRSRTHHYPFRLLTPQTMKQLLQKIVGEEHVEVADAVYPLVVRTGGGSPRDSLSVLDQLIAGSGKDGVTYAEAAGILGVTDATLIDDAVTAIAGGDRAELFECVDRMVRTGHDPRTFAEDLLDRMRDLIMLQAVPDGIERGLVDVSDESRTEIFRQEALAMPSAALTRYAEVLHEGLKSMAGATSPRLLLEVLCARLLLPGAENSVEALAQRLEALERGIPAASAQGSSAPSAPAPAPDAQATQSSPSFGSAPGGAKGAGAERALAALQKLRGGTAAEEKPQATRPQAQPEAQPEPRPETQPEPQPAAVAEPTPEPAPQPEAAPEPEPVVEQAPEPAAPAEGSAEPEAEETDEERTARKAREAREASRRMQEYARQQERREREREAMEKEAATRRAEGLPEEPEAEPEPTPEPVAEPVSAPTPEPAPEPVPEAASEEIPDVAAESAPEVVEELGQVDVGRLRESWADVMAALPETATPVRVLAGAAVPLELDGDTLTIGHRTGALANRLNTPEYSEELSTAVEKVHGITVKVTCVVGVQQSSGARQRQSNAPGTGTDNAGNDPQEGAREPSEKTAPPPAAGPEENIPEYKKVLERRRKEKEAKQAQPAAQAPAPTTRPTQNSTTGGTPAIDEVKRRLQSESGGPRSRRADDDIPPPPEPYDDSLDHEPPPPPPEPYDEGAPPPEDPAPNVRGGDVERGASGSGFENTAPAPGPAPAAAPVSTMSAEEEEYLQSAGAPGQRDTRDLKTVVMELLEKELGAKPL